MSSKFVVEKDGIITFTSNRASIREDYIRPLFREVKKTNKLLILKPHPEERDMGIYKRIAKEVGIDLVIVRGIL